MAGGVRVYAIALLAKRDRHPECHYETAACGCDLERLPPRHIAIPVRKRNADRTENGHPDQLRQAGRRPRNHGVQVTQAVSQSRARREPA